MKQLKAFLNEAWNTVSQLGLSEHEVLGLLACIVLLLMVARIFKGIRRLRRVDHTALSAKVDHLAVQVADLKSQIALLANELSEEKKKRLERSGRGGAAERRVAVELDRPDRSAQSADIAAGSNLTSPEAQAPAAAGGIFAGLKKTRDAFRSRLAQVFGGGRGLTGQSLEELEELLISSDLGVRATARLLEGLSLEAKARGTITGDEAKDILKSRVRTLLGGEEGVEIDIPRFQTKPVVVLVVGVNGVGKTTTIGKLARRFVDQGLKVTLAACDTFRAAAVEQIRVWGERSGVEVVSGDEGVKPTTVLYQAIEKANARGDDVLIVDTAGRLHTRVNLMNELGSIVSMIERLIPGAPHEAILVVDAATGQNALEQAREFGKKVKLSGLIVTKLDGTPKGGIVVAIKEELGIPIRYIGVGEATEDLRVFRADEFVEALFDDAPNTYRASEKRPAPATAGLVH